MGHGCGEGWSWLLSLGQPVPAPASWLVPGTRQRRRLALPGGHVQPRVCAHSQRARTAGWVQRKRHVRLLLLPRVGLPTRAFAVPRRLPPMPPGTQRPPIVRPAHTRSPGSARRALALLHSRPRSRTPSLKGQASWQCHAGVPSPCRALHSSRLVSVP